MVFPKFLKENSARQFTKPHRALAALGLNLILVVILSACGATATNTPVATTPPITPTRTAATVTLPIATVPAITTGGTTAANTSVVTVPVATTASNGATPTTGTSNPNVAVIQRYYEAYARNDLNALRSFFAPNIVWRIPGQHPLAGAKQGADEVLAFFRQLAKASFKAEPLAFVAGGDWVIDLHRGYSTQGQGQLDTLWALAFRIQNNQIVEAINFCFDQASANTFFWANYPLKPLPDRLLVANSAQATPNATTNAIATSTTAQVGTGPSVEVIQRYYETYGQNNPNALRAFFAPNITWRIPGQHPLAGAKQGADEVLAFFNQLAKGGFRAEAYVLASGGEWVVDLHRGYSTQGQGQVDTLWALAFRIQNNQIVEAINFSFDQASANAYFSANYPLKPLTDRLLNP